MKSLFSTLLIVLSMTSFSAFADDKPHAIEIANPWGDLVISQEEYVSSCNVFNDNGFSIESSLYLLDATESIFGTPTFKNEMSISIDIIVDICTGPGAI